MYIQNCFVYSLILNILYNIIRNKETEITNMEKEIIENLIITLMVIVICGLLMYRDIVIMFS